MESSASDQGSRQFIEFEDSIDDKRDKPPPYRQEPIFEGSYAEDDDDLILAGRNLRPNPAGCSDAIEGGIVNPGFQNPPQNPQYPHQLQSSQNIDPHPAQNGAYGPPPNYTANPHDGNGKLRYDAHAPQGMPGAGQQQLYPSPPFHDPRSVATTYPPYATTGQYVVTHQPQGPGGQSYAIMENPPDDYMAYSLFTALCCCWCVGFMAVARSKECRVAIFDGNRELAEEKSKSARNTASVAVGLGILALIIAGVIIGIRVAYVVK